MCLRIVWAASGNEQTYNVGKLALRRQDPGGEYALQCLRELALCWRGIASSKPGWSSTTNRVCGFRLGPSQAIVHAAASWAALINPRARAARGRLVVPVEAVCPDCGARWRRVRNLVELVSSQSAARRASRGLNVALRSVRRAARLRVPVPPLPAD
jgi:hypothetical protein